MSTIQFERASGRLTGPNVPPEAAILPPQYARFSQRPILNSLLDDVRDLAPYAIAYQVMWTTLCMQIDHTNQKSFWQTTRSAIPSSVQPIIEVVTNPDGTAHNVYGALPPKVPEDERSVAIRTYWQGLAESSVYPFFLDTQRKLRFARYGPNMVDTWKLESGQQHALNPYGGPVHSTSYFEAEKIFPFIHNEALDRVAMGFTVRLHDTHSKSSPHFRDLQEQLRIGKHPEFMGYTTLLTMLNLARGYPEYRISGYIQRLERSSSGIKGYEYTPPSWEQVIPNLLRDLEPYYIFQRRLDTALKEWELATFGENADIASALWRSAVNLRYTRLQKGVSPAQVRRPLVEFLMNEDYSGARDWVEDIMARSPGVLPKFVARNLKIDPDTLRELLIEDAKQKEAARLTLKESHQPKPKIKQETEARKTAQKAAEALIDRPMINGDGLTLIIRRRVRHATTPDGGIIESIVHYMESNDLRRLNRVKSPWQVTGLIAAQDIPGLIEKFGFSFAEPTELN